MVSGFGLGFRVEGSGFRVLWFPECTTGPEELLIVPYVLFISIL